MTYLIASSAGAIGPWFGVWPDALLRGALLAITALLWVVLLVRIVGLRSFSKMTSFDFVTTIAMGSLVGSAARTENWPPFIQGLAAIGGLFAIQFVIAWAGRRSNVVDQVVSNTPALIMRDGRFIEPALAETRVDRDEVMAKLRAANVSDISKVHAVVLETTGDISVLHGDTPDEALLKDVRQFTAKNGAS